MSFALVPVAEAALFTFGCLVIHALRRHADVVTATLACLATLLVLMIGIACAPEPFAKYQAAGLMDFAQGEPAIYWRSTRALSAEVDTGSARKERVMTKALSRARLRGDRARL